MKTPSLPEADSGAVGIKPEPVNNIAGKGSGVFISFKFLKHAKGSRQLIKVQVGVDGCMVSMEVDTGASLSLMAQGMFRDLWPGRSLDKSNVKLQGYSQEPIRVVWCKWSTKVRLLNSPLWW